MARNSMAEYKTLEQQIVELWAKRGLRVLEEHFEALDEGKFRWVIIARRDRKSGSSDPHSGASFQVGGKGKRIKELEEGS